MTMVCVRKMLVGMGDRLVMVPVAVTSAQCNGPWVLMTMVSVMLVLVLVIHCLVRVFMNMVLGQVKPDACGHQEARNTELPRDGFFQKQDG